MPRQPGARRRLVLAAMVVACLVTVATVVLVRTLRSSAPPEAASTAVATCDGRPVTAPREVRGMWLTTVYNIDWPSKPGLPEANVKAEYLGWLDLMQRRHLNAVYVHVRPSGDALWPSQYAPWSEWLTGRRDGVGPGWDPLAWMVEQTHARNIEFHAWFNPYRGAQPAPQGGPGADMNKLAPNHPLRAHPEWAIVYPVGTKGSRFYFDPGIPAARTFVEDAMLEAVARYDIDGVAFDDFFYPYPEAGQDFPDAASFATYGKGFASKADWRRNNVDTLIREMSERIRALKPWVKFGVSPFGIWRNARTDPTGSATKGLESYDQIYADTKLWVTRGWVDWIAPQLYWNIGFDKANYTTLVAWWSSVVAGTGVQLYVGQGDYRIGQSGAWSNPAEIDRQLTLNARYNVAGTIHYNAVSIRADKLGAVSRYVRNHFPTEALAPTMSRLPVDRPSAPAAVTVTLSGSTATVQWRPNKATSYAIYRLDANATSASLVGTTRQSSFVDNAVRDGTRYCVSGLDRSANEGPLTMADAAG
jgi:uncharacterized lipoprotein YddW (UPF0748 family)